MKAIHQWLLEHVIWQNVLINLGVGIFLLVLGTRWKLIVAFCKIPPQKLGTWLTKARINSEITKLRMLRRAKRDIIYALPRFAFYLANIFVAVAYAIALLTIIALETYAPTPAPFSHSRHISIAPTRITHLILAIWPTLIVFYFGSRIIWFASCLANSERHQAAILRKIRKLAEKLAISGGSHTVNTLIRGTDLGIYFVGMRVRHPRFGEGVVREVSSDPVVDDRLLVFFPTVGLKRLASKFARLEII